MATTEELLRESQKQNQALMAQIQSLLTEQAKLIDNVQQLSEQLTYLQRKLYGRQSEKLGDPNQTSLFENDSFMEPEQTGEQSEVSTTVGTVERRPRRKRAEVNVANLPHKEVVIDTPDQHCEHGHQLVRIGKQFKHHQLISIPAQHYVEDVYEATYKCMDCELLDGDSHFYHGNAPKSLIAHSLALPSIVTEIAYFKYELGVPLYRQKNYWQHQGIGISDQCMGNWLIKGAETLKPAYQLLHERLVAQSFLQGDETPYQVLREPGKAATSKSYIWLARTIRQAEHQVVFYHYSPSRSGAVAEELYRNFTGVLQCDGYQGYHKVGDSITRGGCWAHVRRKFFDEANADPKHFKASQGLTLLTKMFNLEREWQSLTSEERLTLRQEKLKPLIDTFWTWCKSTQTYANSRLNKAITYAIGQQKALNQVLNFGELDFTNNASERNVKSYVIGRKNWLFSTNPKGAEANAIWMTLIQSAKANGINPRDYIEYLLKTMSQLPTFAKEAQLEACLPWNYKSDQKLATA